MTLRGAALALTTFLAGAVLLGVELAASRVLAPTFGNSLFVWGSLIGVVLTGLSVGYWTGGILADRWPSPRLLVAVVLLGGALVLTVPIVDQRVLEFVQWWDPGPRADPLVAAIILFGPLSVVIATVSPIAVRIASRELHAVGRTAGRLFSISTAGSIAGTFATAFWLVPELGVDQLLAVAAAVLLLAALPLALSDRAWALGAAAVACAAIAAWAAVDLSPSSGGAVSASQLRNYSPIYRTRRDLLENPQEPVLSGYELLERRDTRYHHILVVESERVRYLRFDNSYQSAIDLDDPHAGYFAYTDALQLGLAYRPSARDVLFIGLGGGSAPRRIHRDFPKLELQVVEIDPEVVEIARKWFRFPRSIPVEVEDGRRYLEQDEERHDVIVVDAYYADAVPFHLTTREFLETLRDRLTPGGVVVANILGAVEGEGSKLLRSFVRTYREVFPTVVLHPVYAEGDDSYAVANVILIASTGAPPDVAALRERWHDVRREHPTAPTLDRTIRARVEEVPTNDVPTLTDDYAPTDALLTE